MTTEPRHRRSIAPVATVLGSTSTGAAVAYVQASWQLASLIIGVGLVGSLVQTLMPQNSGDRVKFWSLVFDHARFKWQHKIVPLPRQDSEAIAPPPLHTVPTPEVVAAREVREALGQVIKARRVTRGLSVAAVAEHLGCSSSKIRRLEAGETRPKEDDVRKLAQMLGAPPRDRATWMALARDAQGRAEPPAPPALRGVS